MAFAKFISSKNSTSQTISIRIRTHRITMALNLKLWDYLQTSVYCFVYSRLHLIEAIIHL